MNTLINLTEHAMAFLLLRLFLAIRFIHAFYGKTLNEDGSFDLANLSHFTEKTIDGFSAVLPKFALVPYAVALPWVELLLGAMLLVGFKTRWTLFLTGLTYISLAFGMMLVKNYETVGQIMMHVLVVAFALRWISHNAWCLDKAESN